MSEPRGSIGFSFQAPDEVKIGLIDGFKDENRDNVILQEIDNS